jgi:hypothetical protein
MKLVWSAEELVEHWSVEPKDWANIPDTAEEAGCLGFVAQLTFYRMWARFPDGHLCLQFMPEVSGRWLGDAGVSDCVLR